MRYFAADIDSFLYFYLNGKEALDDARVVKVDSLEGCVTHAADLAAIDFAGIGLGIPRKGAVGSLCPMVGTSGKRHLLVSGSANRHTCKGVVKSRWDGRVPPGSFARIAPGVCVSTPEFIFLQLARKLSTTQLALVGCALCAGYRINAHDKIVKCDPMTSVAEIGRFLDGASRISCSKKAKDALAYVANNAESPQEINSFLLTCLPRENGGRGIRKLRLNYSIAVNPEDGDIVDRPDRMSFRVDMGDPDAHAGSEYLGKQHESTAEKDRARLNALLAKGERLLQVKYADLVDPRLAERHSNQLAALLDEQLVPLTRKQAEERERLVEFLFGQDRLRI